MSSKYRIFETGQFLKDLDNDFSGPQKRIREKLLTYVYPQLREQPFYGLNIRKLKDYTPETWRYRIGDYRFFYHIDEKKKMVFMLIIDLRSNSY